MPEPDPEHHDYLRRLPPGAYRGLAAVHWCMTIGGRKTGWLTREFSLRFREVLTHSCARYGAVCTVYCLMPDHIHLLLQGWRADSDQRLLIKHLRKHLNLNLPRGIELQKQPYDHVLHDEEKGADAFRGVAFYIMENPLRAKLCRAPEEYEFTGSLLPGYPELSCISSDFWERYWRVLEYVKKKERGDP